MELPPLPGCQTAIPASAIGYYPRKTPEAGTANPLRVVYTITGDEDIMATEIQTGWLAAPFEVFTFNHLLTQFVIR